MTQGKKNKVVIYFDPNDDQKKFPDFYYPLLTEKIKEEEYKELIKKINVAVNERPSFILFFLLLLPIAGIIIFVCAYEAASTKIRKKFAKFMELEAQYVQKKHQLLMKYKHVDYRTQKLILKWDSSLDLDFMETISDDMKIVTKEDGVHICNLIGVYEDEEGYPTYGSGHDGGCGLSCKFK